MHSTASQRNSIARRQQGFNLIELLVTIAVLAILLAVGVPSFTTMANNNAIVANTNAMIGELAFARMEAVRRGRFVHISSISGTTAWGSGVRVWYDSDSDGSYDAGEELRILEALPGGKTIVSSGSSDLIFSPDGTVSANQTFDVCDSRSAETGRRISLLGGGGVATADLTCS